MAVTVCGSACRRAGGPTTTSMNAAVIPIFVAACALAGGKSIGNGNGTAVLISKYARVAHWGPANHNLNGSGTGAEEGRNSRGQYFWTHRSDASVATGQMSGDSAPPKPSVAYQYPVYGGKPDGDVEKKQPPAADLPAEGEVIQDRFEPRPYFSYKNKRPMATYGAPAAPPPPPPPPVDAGVAAPSPRPSPDPYTSPYSSYNAPPVPPDDSASMEDQYPPNGRPDGSPDVPDSYPSVGPPYAPEYNQEDAGAGGGGGGGPPPRPPADVYFPPPPDDGNDDDGGAGAGGGPPDHAPMMPMMPGGGDDADLMPPPPRDHDVRDHDPRYPTYLYDQHGFENHVYEEAPHPPPPPPAPAPGDERVNKGHYSYYYLGRKLWYIPLYFSIYFIIYVTILILKSIARHKVQFKHKWVSDHGKKRESRAMSLERKVDELHGLVDVGIRNATRKYSDNVIVM